MCLLLILALCFFACYLVFLWCVYCGVFLNLIDCTECSVCMCEECAIINNKKASGTLGHKCPITLLCIIVIFVVCMIGLL